MKPWEETWTAEPVNGAGRDESVWCVLTAERWRGMRVAISDCVTEERARLAAAAPDMVRVLLEVEWAGRYHDEACCPSCYADAYVLPLQYDAAGRYVGYTKGKHEPDCALDAALRKAGVR